jgi:signal peptidase I
LRHPSADEGPRRFVRAGVLAVVAGALAVLVLHVTVAEVRAVDSDSMTPALQPGERILVAKAGVPRWDLQPGALVVFDGVDLWAGPEDPAGSVFVKRVVGVGGDRITCCTADGRLTRNGVAVDEPYLQGARSDQQEFDVIVAADHYWVLGDNREVSADSRAHLGDPGGGNVPASRIIGTVEAVVWPPGSMRRVEGSDE